MPNRLKEVTAASLIVLLIGVCLGGCASVPPPPLPPRNAPPATAASQTTPPEASHPTPTPSEPPAIELTKSTTEAAMPAAQSPPRNPYARYITPNDPQVQAAVQDILSGEWRWAYDGFEALRQWVWAHVFYRFDSEIYGKDYWQLPAETLALGTGDCEDFAILLCTLLRAYGVSADDVYVAVGCAEEGQGCHAYLLERYYRGIWTVLEPQAELISTLLVFNRDIFTDLMYEERYCFNDQDYFKGAPTLPPGTYEFEVGHSAWPVTRGASVEFQRQLEAGEIVAGSVEWLKDYRIAYDWDLNIYGPEGDPVPSWSGTNRAFSFSFIAARTGLYRIEILKRDYMPRCARLTVNPTDWELK